MKIRRRIAALLACVATSAMILIATPLPASAGCPVAEGQKACGDKCIGLSQCCTSDDCSEGQFCENSSRACIPALASPRPLINVGSGKCFAPTPPQGGNISWAGVPIQQRTCDPNVNAQYYTLKPLGYVISNDGRAPWYCPWCIELGAEGFFIMDRGTGLCLDARDGAKNDGSVVQQWTCREVCTTHFDCKPDTKARSMIWFVGPGDFSGSIKLKNVNSDLCVDVRSGSSDELAQLQQYHCTSNNGAQNFRQGNPCVNC
jgi:hypothetical protein